MFGHDPCHNQCIVLYLFLHTTLKLHCQFKSNGKKLNYSTIPDQ